MYHIGCITCVCLWMCILHCMYVLCVYGNLYSYSTLHRHPPPPPLVLPLQVRKKEKLELPSATQLMLRPALWCYMLYASCFGPPLRWRKVKGGINECYHHKVCVCVREWVCVSAAQALESQLTLWVCGCVGVGVGVWVWVWMWVCLRHSGSREPANGWCWPMAGEFFSSFDAGSVRSCVDWNKCSLLADVRTFVLIRYIVISHGLGV